MPARGCFSVLVGILLVACTASSTGRLETSSSPSSPSPALAPRTCPTDLSRSLARSDVPGRAETLVPDGPTGLVVCNGHTRVVIEDELVTELASLLNDLKHVPSGVEFACPIDLGPTYGLFFNYPDGGLVAVSVSSSGCRFATNGKVSARVTRGLLAQIGSLLG